MCTVSFVKANDKIIITSNRDEKVLREAAVAPQSYTINDKKLIFPKDPKAGGTWYAIDKAGNVLVLLNGAAEKHEVKLHYRKSRGLIVLDIISGDSPLKMWHDIGLDDIEPFTLVLFERRKLYQLRWNGSAKEIVQLDAGQNHIWSSSTLYPKDVRDARSAWFYNFLDTKPEISAAEMYNFHRYTEEGNSENGLVINRNDAMKTLSITQTVIEKKKVLMSHYDLIREHEFANSFSL